MTAQMQHERPLVAKLETPTGYRGRRVYVGQTGAIRQVMAEIGYDLSQVLCDAPDLCGDTELAIAEALNNIEEHSYRGRVGRPVKVSIDLHPDQLDVEISDFGEPMPGLDVPAKKLPDPHVARAALPEGGFGWFLIHTLAPDPIYIRRGNSNLLRFTLRKR